MNHFTTVLKLRRLYDIKQRSQEAWAKAMHKGCDCQACRGGSQVMSLQEFIQTLNSAGAEDVPVPAPADAQKH